MTPTVSARGVAVQLGGKTILDGVDLDVRPGQVLGLVGPNGAGKSTLLRALARLVRTTSGTISSSQGELAALSSRQRARVLAFLPQDTGLDQDFSVRDIVAMGRYAHLSRWRATGADDAAIVAAALARAGVADLAERSVRTLSGGQRQLVLLAKQLAQQPEAYLLDEPVSALDLGHQLAVVDLLRSLAGDGHAVVTVLHDLNLASRTCDVLTVLHHGRVRASGTPADVLTPDLLADVYGVVATVERDAGGTVRVTPLQPVHHPREGTP